VSLRPLLNATAFRSAGRSPKHLAVGVAPRLIGPRLSRRLGRPTPNPWPGRGAPGLPVATQLELDEVVGLHASLYAIGSWEFLANHGSVRAPAPANCSKGANQCKLKASEPCPPARRRRTGVFQPAWGDRVSAGSRCATNGSQYSRVDAVIFFVEGMDDRESRAPALGAPDISPEGTAPAEDQAFPPQPGRNS
jgi:hypothetical protein